MKPKKLRKLLNAKLRWEDKRMQRPFIHKRQWVEYPNFVSPDIISPYVGLDYELYEVEEEGTAIFYNYNIRKDTSS